jgi:LCP family protein required for cell wall assembly
MTVRVRRRHPVLAAFLSFLFPGLGQAATGQRSLAVLLAGPVILIVLGALLLGLALGTELPNSVLSGPFLTGLLVLDLALMAWRVFAIAQVGFARPPATATLRGGTGAAAIERHHELDNARQAGGTGLVVLLIVATIAMHGWAGLVISRLNSTLDEVFSGVGRGPLAGAPDDGPLNRPDYAWDGTERINFLLLGVDAGPGREQALTDTILAVSVDPVSNTAVMVSVPRDTGFMPLPDTSVYPDGLYPRKINELASDASANPELWCPDLPAEAAEACGIRTLERSVGLYLGIPIQYYAEVDLAGFTQMVDALGGLTLCLPGKMVDPGYSGPGLDGRGIELAAGCSPYDGAKALAYARIRQGWIEHTDGTREQQDDFKRAERQQKVLLEMRREFARLDLFFDLPPMLDAVGQTISTDFPRDSAGDLASLLPLIAGPSIERVVLGLPEFTDPPLEPNVNYLLIPRRDAIRAEMERLFGAGALEGWYLGSEAVAPSG